MWLFVICFDDNKNMTQKKTKQNKQKKKKNDQNLVLIRSTSPYLETLLPHIPTRAPTLLKCNID